MLLQSNILKTIHPQKIPEKVFYKKPPRQGCHPIQAKIKRNEINLVSEFSKKSPRKIFQDDCFN